MKDVTIVSAEARPLDVAMRQSFGISGGAQTVAANVLFVVELASGVRGFGEAAPFPAFNGETQAAALADLARARDAVVGRLAGDRLELDLAPSARCALETAMLDALARTERRSLRDVFGGAEDELVTDVTIVTGTADDAARDAARFAAFRTLKIKVGGRDVDHDVARVLAVRAARPDADVFLDANGGFSVDEAVRLASELARRGIVPTLFEQPVAPGSWEALAEVRARTGLRVAADESITCAADVALAARSRAADAVNVKIMKSGVHEAAAIARAAAEAGLDRMVGGLVETRLAMGTSASLAAGLGGFSIVDLDTPLFLAGDPFDGGFAYRGDRVDLRGVTEGHGCVPKLTSSCRP